MRLLFHQSGAHAVEDDELVEVTPDHEQAGTYN